MPATKRDYYEVLGVDRNASDDQIKRAYRRLAMKHHPDRNGNDKSAETAFKACAEAYDVLSDPGKRERYDRFGHDGVQGAARDFSGVDVGDIFSMFEDIFGLGGGRRRGRGPAAGMDLEARVELTLEEVAFGSEKTLEYDRAVVCTICSGQGLKPGARPRTCQACGGQGRVTQHGLGGMFRMVTPCGHCRGRGVTVTADDTCPSCRGTGQKAERRKVKVSVPPGVHEGQAVRVPGEGEAGGPGAPAGDLLCVVTVAEHSVFSRHHNDLVCQVPVSFTQAALGASIEVPVLRPPSDPPAGDEASTTRLDIPAGTQHGQVFTLKGTGLPDVRGARRGDVVVQTLVEIPRKLTPRQEQLLREFAESEDVGTNDLHARKGFLDRLRSFVSGD